MAGDDYQDSEDLIEAARAHAFDDSDEAADIDLSGLWMGRVMEEDTYQVMLQLHQDGDHLSGSIVVYYDDDEDPYLACQNAEGRVLGDEVSLRGVDVRFIPDDPEAEYALDLFEMRVVNRGREMTGRWTDVDRDADGRVVVRRTAAV